MNDINSILEIEENDKEEISNLICDNSPRIAELNLAINSEDLKNNPKDLNKLSTEVMINFISDKLNRLTAKNNFNISKFILKIGQETNFLCADKKIFKYDPDDILIDMKFQNAYTSEFQNYLIKKHEEKASVGSYINDKDLDSNSKHHHFILSRVEEEMNSNPDDIVCLVCNDGDYEDNDLIVYCSSCHMTVHQSCYGIINLPKDDWICYPCLSFGTNRGKEIECLLCPVRGGAMKPCNIKKSGQFYSYLMSLRKDQVIRTSLDKNIISLDISKLGINLEYNSKSNKIENLTPKLNLKNKLNNENVVDMGLGFNFSVNVGNGLYNEKFESKMQTDRISLDSDSESIKYLKISNELPLALNDNQINVKKSEKYCDIETNKQTIISTSSPKKRGRRRKLKKRDKNKKNQNGKDVEELVNSFNEYVNPKIANENAWSHLSCALWLPDVIVEDFLRKEGIKSKFK
jgi:hypothetical protein